mmetsp:Transcript_34897/g.87908  ORF Transcript_34897/g.87908 Transcript_34897/m.87908 type:complete len:250 (+) Transcript_34897:54-803(+)
MQRRHGDGRRGARSVHAALEGARDRLVRGDDVHDGAPARQRVAVLPRHQALRQRLEQLLRLHVRPPRGLAHAVERIGGGARHHKVSGGFHRPNGVHPAQVGRPVALQPRNHRRAEVRPESFLVERGGDEVPEGGGLDVALLPQLVHVVLKLEALAQRLRVRPQARETQVQVVVDLVHLLVVRGQCLELHAQPQVGADGNAVLAGHRHDGRAVHLKDRHPAAPPPGPCSGVCLPARRWHCLLRYTRKLLL